MAKKPTPAPTTPPGQAKKSTSPEVAAIAGRLLSQGDPFEVPGMRESLHKALTACNLKIEADVVSAEEITAQLIDAIRPCFEPWVKDTRSLAASCLSQDEAS